MAKHPPLTERQGPKGREVLLRPHRDPSVRRWTKPSPRPALVDAPEAQSVLAEAQRAGGTVHLSRKRAEAESVHNLVELGMLDLAPNPSHFAYAFQATLQPAGRKYLARRAATGAAMRKATSNELEQGGARFVLQARFPPRREDLRKGATRAAMTAAQGQQLANAALNLLQRPPGANGTGTFTIGELLFTFHKAQGKPAYVTVTGGTLPVPFHMVCSSWDDALRKGRHAAEKFAAGETPDEGLYMATGIRSTPAPHFGGVPLRKAVVRRWHPPGSEGVRLLPPPVPNRAQHPYPGTIVYQGLLIYVENPKGSTRSGTAQDGTKWAVTMPAHYGEFAGTLGMDGDPVDVFVGDDADAPDAFVVHQKVPGTQRPDEDKVILGVRTAEEAKALFMRAYTKPGFFHGITKWRLDDLRAHLLEGREPGARLDLPPHLAQMIKAARSSTMLLALLKAAQLALFAATLKHPDFVHVPTYVRKDGTVVKEHTRRARPGARAPKAPTPPKVHDQQHALFAAAHAAHVAPEAKVEPWQQEKKGTLWYQSKAEVPMLGAFVGTKDGPRKVTAVSVTHVREDAMSFGAPGGMDQGYAAAVVLAPVDPVARAAHEKQAADKAVKAATEATERGIMEKLLNESMLGEMDGGAAPGGVEYVLEDTNDRGMSRRTGLLLGDDGKWYRTHKSSTYDDSRDLVFPFTPEGAKIAAKVVADRNMQGVRREDVSTAKAAAAERAEAAHLAYLVKQRATNVARSTADVEEINAANPALDARYEPDPDRIGKLSVAAGVADDLVKEAGFEVEGERMVRYHLPETPTPSRGGHPPGASDTGISATVAAHIVYHINAETKKQAAKAKASAQRAGKRVEPRITVDTQIPTTAAATAAATASDIAGEYGTSASVSVVKSGRSWLLQGNTYPIKDALRAHGATWDGAKKAWKISDDKAEAAGEALLRTLRSAPAYPSRGGHRR